MSENEQGVQMTTQEKQLRVPENTEQSSEKMFQSADESDESE